MFWNTIHALRNDYTSGEQYTFSNLKYVHSTHYNEQYDESELTPEESTLLCFILYTCWMKSIHCLCTFLHGGVGEDRGEDGLSTLDSEHQLQGVLSGRLQATQYVVPLRLEDEGPHWHQQLPHPRVGVWLSPGKTTVQSFQPYHSELLKH